MEKYNNIENNLAISSLFNAACMSYQPHAYENLRLLWDQVLAVTIHQYVHNIFSLYFQEYDAQSPGRPDSHGEDASVLCYCGNASTSPCHVSGREADRGRPRPRDQSHIWLHADHLKDPWHPPLREPRLQEPHHRYWTCCLSVLSAFSVWHSWH